MRILTFDIGGANTKRLVADFHDEGFEVISSDTCYFPFWKRKEEFKSFLLTKKEPADCVAVTMTAELSDTFSNKSEGVAYVVSTCEKVFKNPFYLSLDGKLLRHHNLKRPLDLAAANWIASLYYLEKKYKEGILLDVGSTTTDIIPFREGEVLYEKTDLERLRNGQLLYTGMLRTPVSALVSRVPFRNKMTRISSEYFAITADVYNVLGMLKNYRCDTPDGRGKRKIDSARRLARLLCADLKEVGKAEVLKICEYIHKRQVEDISEALKQVAEKIKNAYACGVGKALAIEACNKAGVKAIDLSELTKAYDNLPCLGLAVMVREHACG